MRAPSIKESTEVVPLLIRFYRSEADKASHKNLKHVPLHPTDAEGKIVFLNLSEVCSPQGLQE